MANNIRKCCRLPGLNINLQTTVQWKILRMADLYLFDFNDTTFKASGWTDVDMDRRQLKICRSDWRGHVDVTKGGRSRIVPMTERLLQELSSHRRTRCPLVLHQKWGRPFTSRLLQGLVRRSARLAKLEHRGVHVLRHTFCSHLAMRGVPARACR